MNVLIHGPFGVGSLADEAQLAGLLARFSGTSHGVTVLSANPEQTRLLHNGVNTIEYDSPKKLLSNRAVWAAFDTSHLFVLTSAGPINYEGELPARFWLNQMELTQKAGLKSAVVGVRAERIAEMRESVRAQRLLHHFADTICVRDDTSKRALADQGVNPNRVSVNGDPALGLQPAVERCEKNRIALFVSPTLPARTEFSFNPPKASMESDHAQRLRALIASLLESGAALTLVHDDATPVLEFLRDLLAGFDTERLTLLAPDRPFSEVLSAIAGCETAFACSYHGVLLSSLCGVPALGIANEPAAPELLKALGLEDCSVSAADFSTVPARLEKLAAERAPLNAQIQKRVGDLRRKEAQNLRAMEALVPKREVYAREKQRAKESEAADPLEDGARLRPRKKRRER